MNVFRKAIALSTVSILLSGGVAFAQQHHDDYHQDANHQQDNRQGDHDHYVRHDEWRKGARMRHEDWQRGQRIDYRHYHLHAPPRGYEWREVDGNYVLAAVATGVIASVIAASHAH